MFGSVVQSAFEDDQLQNHTLKGIEAPIERYAGMKRLMSARFGTDRFQGPVPLSDWAISISVDHLFGSRRMLRGPERLKGLARKAPTE